MITGIHNLRPKQDLHNHTEHPKHDDRFPRMVNKSEHIEIPEVGCPRFANVKRQLEAEDARENESI